MLIICLLASLVLGQQAHSSSGEHGAMVMGFDQTKTAHHFYLYRDGGAIEVDVKNPADGADLDAVRSHLPHIARMFGDGDFDAPMMVHDTDNVPGIGVLAAHKANVRYRYQQIPAGGRVDITTTDPAALAALHDFLRYQIHEHHTGDIEAVTSRQ